MRTIIFLAFGLFCVSAVQAQVGSSISADGTAPNTNAMLDVQSPSTGAGKGILIPRLTGNQRTNVNASLAGGLLDGSGNLRGGVAQGLIVYQTDGSQGLYFNTSQTAAPTWVYLGNSTTNYLPLTGGTMSGALNMGAQIVTNVSHIDFNGNDVSIGRGANGLFYGVAVGATANGYFSGAALGVEANGYWYGSVVGYRAKGYDFGSAVGHYANGTSKGAALGYYANGSVTGAAVGVSANGYNNGAAMGYAATGSVYGAAVGYYANGKNSGAAVGRSANGYSSGAALGDSANGSDGGAAVGDSADGNSGGAALGGSAIGSENGAAVGASANGNYYGAALGMQADGYDYGAALGYQANGSPFGAAVGRLANGSSSGAAVGDHATGTTFGVAVGLLANGAQTNVAIGAYANARGSTQRIAIGYQVTNFVDSSAVIRGTLYLDGGTGVVYRETFGSGSWANKAFMIDHPLDLENKVLRHFCLEGPQVWNVYAGNAQLVNGLAVVELPDYYSALNLVGSEIYSLTVVGALAQIAVGAEVNKNQFTIIGDKDVKVSWTIKVLRNDPGCLEDLRRRPVEQLKRELR